MEKNLAAQRLHEVGLHAALAHDFVRAYSAFEFALDVLNDEPESIGKTAQVADIARDQGFTIVREAIGAELLIDTTNYLGVAWQHLHNVEANVSDVLAPGTVNKHEQEILLANRGATRALLGRTATVAALEGLATILDDDHSDPIEAGRIFYRRAHVDLCHGNNGYYRVSNAMNAARHERLFGSSMAAIKWLGRAATGLRWTYSHDIDNFGPAWHTFRERIPHLRNKGMAADSVLAKP